MDMFCATAAFLPKKCVSNTRSHLCGVASLVGDPIPDKTLKKKSDKISGLISVKENSWCRYDSLQAYKLHTRPLSLSRFISLRVIPVSHYNSLYHLSKM